MRIHKTIGVLGMLVLPLALPLATACYAPRVESCRGALDDFSIVSEVELVDVHNDVGIFEARGSAGASFRVHATGPSSVGCIAIRSQLFSGGSLVHVLETTVTASPDGDGFTTTPLYHYRAGDRLVVTVLGTTLEAEIPSGYYADAGMPDARVDAPSLDASDAALPDASRDDAGFDDAGLGDAGFDDAGDAGPAEDDAGIPDAG